MYIQKKGLTILVALMVAITIPLSLEARIRNRIGVDEVPDMEYTVYFYHGHRPSSLLAVFDIPDDDFRVFMYHTALTRRETGSPDRYIGQFQRRIKGFKTAYQIMDKSGEVRGYLMASRFVRYQFLSSENEIGVRVLDYSNRVEGGAAPRRFKETGLLPQRGVHAALGCLRPRSPLHIDRVRMVF